MSRELKKAGPSEAALPQSSFDILNIFYSCSANSRVHIVVITALIMKENYPKGIAIK